MISFRWLGIKEVMFLCVLATVGCSHIAQPGHVLDEAKQVGRPSIPSLLPVKITSIAWMAELRLRRKKSKDATRG